MFERSSALSPDYSTTNTGWLDAAVSRLRIATKQVVARPTLLLEAVTKWNLRGLYLPDRKRILIDQAVPIVKQRWIEGHEITHGILPWHAELMLGDTEQTLNRTCHEHLEAERTTVPASCSFYATASLTKLGPAPHHRHCSSSRHRFWQYSHFDLVAFRRIRSCCSADLWRSDGPSASALSTRGLRSNRTLPVFHPLAGFRPTILADYRG